MHKLFNLVKKTVKFYSTKYNIQESTQDDILQDFLEKWFKHNKSMECPDEPLLKKIIKNMCLDFIRTNNSNGKKLSSFIETQSPSQYPPTPEDEYRINQFFENINSIKLHKRLDQILDLIDEGIKQKDIASMLNMTPSAISKMRSRFIQKIRKNF